MKRYMKGCQVFAMNMEKKLNDKVPSVEDCTVMKEFEDVFKDLSGFPPKRDIYFYITIIPRAPTISKTPYRMSMI
jgi:hypothetical protein